MKRPNYSQEIHDICTKIFSEKTPRSDLSSLKKRLREIPLSLETVDAWRKHYFQIKGNPKLSPQRKKTFTQPALSKIREITPSDGELYHKIKQDFYDDDAKQALSSNPVYAS